MLVIQPVHVLNGHNTNCRCRSKTQNISLNKNCLYYIFLTQTNLSNFVHVLKLFYSEKLSEFLRGIEPVTWLLVRCSNHNELYWLGWWVKVRFMYWFLMMVDMYCQSASLNILPLCVVDPCSSMVRASHQRSEGYWFVSCQTLRKFFWVK